MATERELTIEEYFASDRSPKPTELVRGTIVEHEFHEMLHGLACVQASSKLFGYVREREIGWGGIGMPVVTQRNPDTLRSADVAFYTTPHPESDKLYDDSIVPRLIVEIRSVHERPGELAEKVREYLGIGVASVVVLHPRELTAELYAVGDPPQFLQASDILRLPAPFAGLNDPVQDWIEQQRGDAARFG